MIENYVEKQGNNLNMGYMLHMRMTRNNIHIRNITLQVAKNANGIKMERLRQNIMIVKGECLIN
jgi:hypothetical protein